MTTGPETIAAAIRDGFRELAEAARSVRLPFTDDEARRWALGQAETPMYPVCARHVRQGHMIPLADLLAEVWDQSYLAEVEHKATSNPYRQESSR